MDFSRYMNCKPLLWALFGVFLLGFGAVGLTTCSDGSKRLSQIAQLEDNNKTLAGERAELEARFEALEAEKAALAAEKEELAGSMGSVRSSFADLNVEGVSADGDAAAQVTALGAQIASLKSELSGSAEKLSAQESSSKLRSPNGPPETPPVSNGLRRFALNSQPPPLLRTRLTISRCSLMKRWSVKPTRHCWLMRAH